MNRPVFSTAALALLAGCTHVSVDEIRADGTEVHATYTSTRDLEAPNFTLKKNAASGDVEASFGAESVSASNPLAAGADLVRAGADAVLRGAELAAGM